MRCRRRCLRKACWRPASGFRRYRKARRGCAPSLPRRTRAGNWTARWRCLRGWERSWGFCMGEPSLRYTKVSLFCGIPGIHFEYISGRNQRHEYRNSQGDRYGPLRALILNLDLHYGFDLDLEARIYSETRINDSGFLLDPGPRQIERKPSGRTRHYHIETVDTGKRRQMFGHTARRVKMRTTEKVEPQGDSPKTE